MAIKVITDSAADFLPSEAKELGIEFVPLTVNFAGTDYADAVEIDHNEFFEKLTASDKLPTTSQVTPAAFKEVFERNTQNGDTVIAITISSKLSGTYQSAVIAADDFGGKVFVIDSLNATVGQRLMVLQCLEYIKQGMEASDIVNRLTEDRAKIRLLAVLDTLEYLKKGGRISAAVAFAGGLLSIKPVISVVDGEVVLVGKARGSKNGNNLLRKLVGESRGIDFARPLSLVYSGLSTESLQKYVKDSEDLYEEYEGTLPCATIGAVIGTHVGPGAIGVAFFEKD